MSGTAMTGFLNRVKSAIEPADSRTDAQLLSAFSDHRDAGAFGVLVRRYGSLVWTVCRRVSGTDHAEDAFQATFLVLVRKAAAVRPRHSLGGWLHRTATHISLKARTMNDRRTRRESASALPERAAEPPEPPDPAALSALDEEIARLPNGLRIAVVLCELEGVTRREAAARLGIAEGTVSSRLAAARKKLAARLRKRGVSATGGIAGLLATHRFAEAGAPPRLTATAVALGAGAKPSVPVDTLTAGEIRSLFLAKLLAGVAIAVMVAAAGLWPAVPTTATHPRTPRAAPVPPAAPREGVIVVNSFQPNPPAVILTPDGKEVGQVAVGNAAAPINPGEQPVCPLLGGRLSPDGKRLAALKLGPIPQNSVGPWTPQHLWVFDLDSKDGPGEALMTDVRYPSVAWSPDGTKLYGSHVDPDKVADPREEGKPPPLVSWTYDFKTKKKTPLALPLGHAVADVSPDGKSLLTVVLDPFDRTGCRSFVAPLDTLKPRPLTETAFQGMRFSPDGKSVLGRQFGKRGETPASFTVVSVADGTTRHVPAPAETVWVESVCWSPDGKRIAYVWYEAVAGPPGADGAPRKGNAGRVTVADADGRNAKTIVRRGYDEYIRGLDWR